MPELPEVEIVKKSLSKMIINTKIASIKINNKNLRYKLANNFKKDLINEKIIKISRRSKYLIFHFKKKFLLLHLGMTGKLLIKRKIDNEMFKTSFYYDLNILPKHNHIYFSLNNKLILIYNDVRRFGFLKVYKNVNLNNIKFLNKLGLEPLTKSFNKKYFKNFIQKRRLKIKSLLMDQTFVCGLGNIYINEALFMSKINPTRWCYSLSDNEIKKLILNIKTILMFSISKGGSSIKDFKNTSGKKGSFQQFFKVYGKENQNCSRVSCSGKIKKILISNRSSFYCDFCQL